MSDTKSLQEVHQSVSTDHKKWYRKIFAFFGPAYLIAVGYMDPGNWATDLAGGSKFGYTLIWVLLMSNLMALLLQTLSARLGIVRGVDLAQANREYYPKWLNYILYAFAELAIAATDLAEVLGMAIGLQLLFGLDLLTGVAITILDTFLLLVLQRYGIRKMEAFIISLVSIIGFAFLAEMFIAQPDLIAISKGFKPSIPNNEALYIAIGIIGATVMPHNLYLHSALVQTRKIRKDEKSIRSALRYNFFDSLIALNLAFFVNAAILVLAAAAFYKTGNHEVAGLHEAHQLLSSVLGSKFAPILFAIALIAAGQSSTITGTLAGQIVMEGYLNLRMSPWVRRLFTRLIAIIPACLVIFFLGEKMVDAMLIFSQVLLSMQLGFAVIPLIHFVSDRNKMQQFTISLPIKIIAWVISTIILALNIKLVYETTSKWFVATDNYFLRFLILTISILLLATLVIVIIYPLIVRAKERKFTLHRTPVEYKAQEVKAFKTIGLALDFSKADERVLNYALKVMEENAEIVLFHITESPTATYHGKQAGDYEVQFDENQLNKYKTQLESKAIKVKTVLGFGKASQALPELINEQSLDLFIMARHGHKGIADILFGSTAETVRHQIDIPIMMV